MIFQGRFLTKQDGLSTDSLSRLKRSTTKRKVASDLQLVSAVAGGQNSRQSLNTSSKPDFKFYIFFNIQIRQMGLAKVL